MLILSQEIQEFDIQLSKKVYDKEGFRSSGWGICINDKGKILILKRSNKVNNPGLLNFPGGNIDEGEKYFQGCLREIKEETQIRKKDLTLVDKKLVVSNGDLTKVKRKMSCFIFRIDRSAKIKINSESSKVMWVSLKDLKHLKNKLHEPTRVLLFHSSIMNMVKQEIDRIRNKKK